VLQPQNYKKLLTITENKQLKPFAQLAQPKWYYSNCYRGITRPTRKWKGRRTLSVVAPVPKEMESQNRSKESATLFELCRSKTWSVSHVYRCSRFRTGWFWLPAIARYS
jgi:hypothetical protein